MLKKLTKKVKLVLMILMIVIFCSSFCISIFAKKEELKIFTFIITNLLYFAFFICGAKLSIKSKNKKSLFFLVLYVVSAYILYLIYFLRSINIEYSIFNAILILVLIIIAIIIISLTINPIKQ